MTAAIRHNADLTAASYLFKTYQLLAPNFNSFIVILFSCFLSGTLAITKFLMNFFQSIQKFAASVWIRRVDRGTVRCDYICDVIEGFLLFRSDFVIDSICNCCRSRNSTLSKKDFVCFCRVDQVIQYCNCCIRILCISADSEVHSRFQVVGF